MKDENDDFEFEDVTEDGAQSDKLKKLKSELQKAKKEAQDNLDGWQRARADYANLKKTSAEETKELREYVTHGFVEELLPVLDSFEMAMKNREVWESVSENWRKGIEYIYNQVKGILANNGISEIGEVGAKFNPDEYQAIEEVETDDENKDHTIAEVVQRGYKGSKGVIRPAKVKIFISK